MSAPRSIEFNKYIFAGIKDYIAEGFGNDYFHWAIVGFGDFLRFNGGMDIASQEFLNPSMNGIGNNLSSFIESKVSTLYVYIYIWRCIYIWRRNREEK